MIRTTRVFALAVAVSFGIGPAAVADVPKTRGLVLDGLEWATDGPCQGLFRVKGTDLCTHGPDEDTAEGDGWEAPPGRADHVGVICDGDGRSGPRVQLVYARASDVADRYASTVTSIRLRGAEADAVLSDSAAKTGGRRHIRFVHDSGCTPEVANAVMSPSGDDDFQKTITELRNLGFNRTDRKYVAFVDSTVYCGIATSKRDDQPGPANTNNGGPSYSRIDSGCWNWAVTAHELMHNLGAVQVSAPHSTQAGHCTDEYDRMCYPDAPNVAMQFSCPSTALERLYDCNDDDYFSTAPPAASYLASHWNTANSVFLIEHGESGAFRADADYDGDGRADFAVWRQSTGMWWIVPSSNGAVTSRQWGLPNDVPVPADYDGDGRADLAVWRPSTGVWWGVLSSTGTVQSHQWGLNGDMPVPADYNGDGRADIAVWRPSDGNWYVLYVGWYTFSTVQQWGVKGDTPVPADYDGDGRDDFAVWRRSTGQWWVIGSFNSGVHYVQSWGLREDNPVPADFNGDGRVELTVWRPSNGNWYAADMFTGATWSWKWGAIKDHPVPADYDGDRRADAAVWRPSTGDWWVLTSRSGVWTRQWGLNGDLPVA